MQKGSSTTRDAGDDELVEQVPVERNPTKPKKGSLPRLDYKK